MENYKQWMEQKLTSEDMDKLPKVHKPLTEDQIKSLEHEYLSYETFDEGEYGTEVNIYGALEFARAIEKAHGIK